MLLLIVALNGVDVRRAALVTSSAWHMFSNIGVNAVTVIRLPSDCRSTHAWKRSLHVSIFCVTPHLVQSPSTSEVSATLLWKDGDAYLRSWPLNPVITFKKVHVETFRVCAAPVEKYIYIIIYRKIAPVVRLGWLAPARQLYAPGRPVITPRRARSPTRRAPRSGTRTQLKSTVAQAGRVVARAAREMSGCGRPVMT